MRIVTGLVTVLSLLSCKQGGAPGSDISGVVLAPALVALPATPGITVFAGGLGGSGNLDGNGTAARFNAPGGVAVAADGTAYVVDTSDHTVRKITPTGDVSTFAGKPGESGSADGLGGAARFNSPTGVAVAPDQTIYVTDTGNFTVRKITPAGDVSTLAGLAGSFGHTDGTSDDGTGTAARFNSPVGIAVAADGTVYVSDSLSSTIREITPAGDVSTFAGSKGLAAGVDGTGSAARFSLPAGLAFDSSGNLYVVDTGLHTIRKITPAAVVSTLAGASGSPGSTDGGSSGRFFLPAFITVDSNNVLYVTDSGNKTIRQVTQAGVVTTLAGSAGVDGTTDGVGTLARFSFPTGLAVGGDGNLLVADSGANHVLRRITLPGADVTTPYGTVAQTGFTNANGTAARFNLPVGMVMDSQGNVLVADAANHVIRRITPAGDVSVYAGTPGTAGATNGDVGLARFNSPQGLAIDIDGTVYVADTGNHVIRKITTVSGVSTVSTLAGLPGSFGTANGTGSGARFKLPYGLTVDISGDVYVADTGNHAIRKITPAGVVTTLAGAPGAYGTTDGTGLLARFNTPFGIAQDGAGNLYVADTGNRIIRKVTQAGVVTTVAGLASTPGTADGLATTDARFIFPVGVVVDADDNVYVADAGGSTIRKISAGVVSTEVGTVGRRGVAEGPITTTDKGTLNTPQGLLIGPQGELYVTDENAVLLVVLNPLLPTFQVRLSAPSQLSLNDNFTLRWNATDAQNCVASGNDARWSGSVAASGSMALTANSLDPDMSYSLNCSQISGAGNKTATVSVSVTQPPPTVTLTTSADRVDPNGSVTLTWSSTNATSCTASGDWSGSKAASGSETLSNLTSGKTFTLECSGEGGTTDPVSKSVVVATLSLNASRHHIALGESVTLSWSSSNTTACTAGDSWSGAQPTSGSKVIKPGNSVAQTYSLRCTGPGGAVSDSVVVAVDFSTSTSGNASGSGGAAGLDLLLGGGLLALLRRRVARRSA